MPQPSDLLAGLTDNQAEIAVMLAVDRSGTSLDLLVHYLRSVGVGASRARIREWRGTC